MVLTTLVSAGEDGERGDKYEQAAVPGSSDPSGQSQKSSLTRAKGILTEGLEMQVNVTFCVMHVTRKTLI